MKTRATTTSVCVRTRCDRCESVSPRALAALDAESVDSADVARLGPAVVAAVRGATRHPLANELAAFFRIVTRSKEARNHHRVRRDWRGGRKKEG